MKQKLLSILALLLMTATGAWADFTVTWTASDMENPGIKIYFNYGEAFNNNINGITVTASVGGSGDRSRTDIYNESGSTTITFTSSVGNIKSIAITAENFMMLGGIPSGWTWPNSNMLSWSGDASNTVSMTLPERTIIYGISEIVFTIESSTVNVTGITLDKTEASMIVGGETLTLTPTVAPNDATDKTVTWTTSDADVATVADGVVSAVAAGTATITATATNGTADTSDDFSTTCIVTVSNPPTVTANEGATGEYWATYYNANATQGFTADVNTTVFQAALTGSQLTMTEVANREIPANSPVILKSSSSTITLTPATTTATLDGNQLQGTATAITNPGNAYVLSKKNGVVGFYKLSPSGTIGANKAYLTYSGGGAPSFLNFVEGNVTGIEMPKAETTDSDAEVYDLQGRRVANPTKGLYIVNGKKVFINK